MFRGFLRVRSSTPFSTDNRGTIAILSALILPSLLIAAAMAGDVASVYLDRRTSQSAVDLAAINAANNMSIATEAARATLTANNLLGYKSLVVTKGNYTADTRLAPEARFKPGQMPFNAVHVALTKSSKQYFSRHFWKKGVTVTVTSLAHTTDQAAFSIGSRLAALRGGLTNQVMGALLGTNVTLTAMDYDSLLGANIRIDDLLGAIDGKLDLNAVTFNDVLRTNASVSDIIAAAGSVLSKDGNSRGANVLAALGRGSPSTLRVPLSSLIDAGSLASATMGAKSALAAKVNALDVVRAAGEIANANRQLAVALNVNLLNITKLTVDLMVGERPQHSSWVTVGEVGARVTTTQMRLRIVAEARGTGLLNGTGIHLPLYVEVASGEAVLKEISCSDQREHSATLAVTPSAGRIALADLTNAELASPPNSFAAAKLVTLPLLSITAQSQLQITNLSPQDVDFTQSDVDDQTIKRVGTEDLTASAFSSLLGSANIRITTLGIGAPLINLSQLLAILMPIGSTLDPVVSELLRALGVSIGEADVTMHAISCGRSNLAG